MSRSTGITVAIAATIAAIAVYAFVSRGLSDDAQQENYPSKDITVIVGYAPGGGTDVLARTVAKFMEKYIDANVAVVVKNVPGAGGQIGFTTTAHAKADGYTLATISLPGALARTIDRKTEYNLASFSYLANFINDPNVIVASEASGIQSVEMMLAGAKKAAGLLTVGIPTIGGDDQFAMIAVSELTDTEYNYIPFKGTAAVRTALMGGHIDLSVMNLSEVVGFRDEFRILAIMANDRASVLPLVPTLKELGHDLQRGSLRGFVAPAGLPAEVSTRLLRLFKTVYEDPDFRQIMTDQGNPVELVVGQEFEELARTQYEIAKEIWNAAPWR